MLVLGAVVFILVALAIWSVGLKKAVGRRTAELQAFVDAIPDLLVTIHRDGTFVSYREGRLHDSFIPGKYIGNKIEEILPVNIAREIMQRVGLTLISKDVQDFECTMQTEAGVAFFELRIVASGKDEALAIIEI